MRMLIARVQVYRSWRKVRSAERRAVLATWPRWRRWTHIALITMGEMTYTFLAMVILAWAAWWRLGITI